MNAFRQFPEMALRVHRSCAKRRANAAAARPDDEAARLSSLIEWLEEGVVLFDSNHEIRAMNSRFAQIAGLAAEETCRITTLWLDRTPGGSSRGTRELRRALA
jgi:PAS domain-containing protein